MEIRSTLGTMMQRLTRAVAPLAARPGQLPLTDVLSVSTAPRTMPAMAALEGGLDRTPMLNSNHPEVLLGPGIAASTLPWDGPAHLDAAFSGAFEVFAHHQNRSGRTLHQAVALHNPGPHAVTIAIGPSATATTDSAPFWDHGPAPKVDPFGGFASGPGDVVAAALLRGERAVETQTLTIQPGQTRLLHSRAVPTGNEVTSQFKLRSDGPVHAAVVFEEGTPTERSVETRLRGGAMLPRNPKDLAPTPPGAPGRVIYGRVSGIQEGATWRARATNDTAQSRFLADAPGEQSFLINGLAGNTLGTNQVQTAPVVRRYEDTAYAAHGNYGVGYEIELPLANPGGAGREVAIHFDTPGAPAPMSRAFRGTIAIDLPDGSTRYVHVSQKRGERGETPLAVVPLPPGAQRTARVRFLYPADATPPHALRLVTRPAGAPDAASGMAQAFGRLLVLAEGGSRAVIRAVKAQLLA
jgi:hypothetical protein